MAPASRYGSNERIVQLYRGIHEGIRAIPGVDEASMSSRLPFGNRRWGSDFTTEGWPADRFGIEVRHDEITPGLFRTMGVPLLRGRDFDRGDALDSQLVVIINEALSTTYFPGEDPIGKRVTFSRTPDGSSPWRTIVGVVSNVRRETLRLEEKPSFYAPVFQDTTRLVHVLIRSERDVPSLLASAQERVDAMDPALPLFDVTTLEAELAASVGRERFLLVLLIIAAVVALVLASVGIFGVVWHATTRRVREIGIRMALGARASAVMALVIREGLRPVVLGGAAGVVAAGVMARTMSSLLFEVEPLDPLTFAVVFSIVLVSATGACALPARWATRVDQTSALRAE
jgi:predicted permease